MSVVLAAVLAISQVNLLAYADTDLGSSDEVIVDASSSDGLPTITEAEQNVQDSNNGSDASGDTTTTETNTSEEQGTDEVSNEAIVTDESTNEDAGVATLSNDAVTQVANFEEFTQAIADGAEAIEITGQIVIPAGSDIVAENVVIQPVSGIGNAIGGEYNPIILVEQGASFTLGEGAVYDGANVTANVFALKVNGTFNLAGGAIQNWDYNGSGYRGLDTYVYITGEQAVFNFTDGSISNNGAPQCYGSIVYADQGATVNMSGGVVENNRSVTQGGSITSATAVFWIGSEFQNPQGGSTHNSSAQGATFNFSGGTFQNNASFFIVAIGDYASVLRTYDNPATMVMSGSATIQNNEATYPTLTSWGAAEVTMNAGTITGNTAGYGAGVGAVDLYVGENSAGDKVTQSGTLEEWSAHCPARFTMDGGTISNNSATYGGGIYVASNNVPLNAGTISGNTARQGGGVYVGTTPYVLKVNNSLLTGNTATKAEDGTGGIGGGIWICPTGDAHNSVKNGTAIFDNSAEAAADDVASVKHTKDAINYDAYVSLTNVMLGNWLTNWYQDGAIQYVPDAYSPSTNLGMADENVARYSVDGENVLVGGVIEPTNDFVALKSVPSQAGKDAATEAAQLVISNNQATWGGGIGTNGIVEFGEHEIEAPEYISLTVTKQWDDNNNADGKRPESVTLNLYRDGIQIDQVVVTPDENGNWSYTWESLLKYQGEEGNANPNSGDESVYTVTEEPVEGYTTTGGEVQAGSDGNLTAVITNTYTPEPIEPDNPDPENPDDTENPETPDTSDDGQKPGSDAKQNNAEDELPQTSDNSPVAYVVPAAIIGGAALIGSIYLRRRGWNN